MLKKSAKYYWWCQLGGWLFWMFLNIVLANYYHRPMGATYFLNQICMVIVGIGLTHLLRMVIISANWLQYSLDKLIIRLAIAVTICALLMTLIRGMINIYLHLGSKDEERLFSLWMFIGASLLVTTWTTLYFLWHYFQKDQQYKLDKLQLESVVKDLELRTIKSQLNPHFLFNALNSIRALIDENPERARTAVTELSNILRGSIQTEKLVTVTLDNELNTVRDYLALENIRYEERLKVHFDIDPATRDLPVPPMMLQTLVENAIKHGISKSVEGGFLNIRSYIKGVKHIISIQNTGQLKRNINNGGFGLQSTRQRLELLYKNKASFEIKNLNNHTVEVTVSIDL